jgi:hypothetical protein
MNLLYLAASLSSAGITSNEIWLAMTAGLITAGAITARQVRRKKKRLWFQALFMKLLVNRKRKLEKPGLFILSLILIAGCFAVAISLGMLKEFLIAIGAVVLLLILLINAGKNG